MSLGDPALPARKITADPPGRRFGFSWLLFAAGLWIVFIGLSLFRWPIPGINEPHYLSKARHLLDPTWCAGDFFLESSNPHYATSWLLGQLTQRFSLDAAALIGRILALGVLAIGWTSMLSRVARTFSSALLITAIFLVLQIWGNWSGEWLLRGVEGKVFAWGFLFLSIGQATAGRWAWAGLAMGLSTTFHPVIGAWGAISAGLAMIWTWMSNGAADVSPRPAERRSIPSDLPAGRGAGGEGLKPTRAEDTPSPQPSPPITSNLRSGSLAGERGPLLVAIIVFALAAAPGVWFALPALRLGTADQRWQADHIQVVQRLTHHLDPASFAWSNHREYALLLVMIWLMRRPGANRTFTERVAWMAVLCAVGGIVVSIWPRTTDHFNLYVLRLKLLKLYPFRLADVFIPLLFALRVVDQPRIASVSERPALASLLSAAMLVVTLFWPGDESAASKMGTADLADWKRLLSWVRDNTPRESLVQAMNEDFAVKWTAERPEFVNYKDCPQDAPGLLEWHERLTRLDAWKQPAMADFVVTAAELQQLHEQTGIDYLLVSRFGPIKTAPLFTSGKFRVYATQPSVEGHASISPRPGTPERGAGGEGPNVQSISIRRLIVADAAGVGADAGSIRHVVVIDAPVLSDLDTDTALRAGAAR
jgi:hypothetical protein